MPVFGGDPKPLPERTNGNLLISMMVLNVMCGIIAIAIIAALIRDHSVGMPVFYGAGLAFIVYSYSTVSWSLVGELLRRRNSRR